MKPTSSSFNAKEAEFENLLATAEERMRQRHHAPRALSSPSRLSMLRDLSVLLLAVIAVAVTASCVRNLTLTPKTATVATGQTATFTATFDPNGGHIVSTTWILTQNGSTTSCSPGCGTLTTSGADSAPTATATYTAPSTVPTTSTVTLTFAVTDTQPVTLTASSTITIIAASNALTVSPQTQTVIGGSTTTQQFTANESGSAATGITWALAQNGSSCLAAACGSIGTATANPVTYTPPTTFSASGSVTLTATQASSSQSSSATITIQAATLQSLAVMPTGASIQVGQQQAFTATASYNNGQQQTVTSGLSWNSNTPSVASIDQTGTATGLHAGTTQISAALTSPSIASSGVTLTVTPPPAATIPRYLFEINGDSTVSTYAVVPSTGQLRSVTYFSTGGTAGVPAVAALNPNGNVLYDAVSVAGGQQLTTYSISVGGVLSQVASSMNAEGTFGQLVVDPLGRFLWVADITTSHILSYPLDSNTGVPGTQTTAASVSGVELIAADPTGTYLFSEDSSGTVAAYTVTSGGTLVPLGTPPSVGPIGPGSATMIVDPSGKYLYLMESSSINLLFGYTISSTGLTSMSGSPFTVPNNAGTDTQMAIDPSSSFLYALDSSSPSQPIDAFVIGIGGALTPLSETVQGPAMGFASRINIDPSGKYAFVAYSSVREVWTYAIAQTGANRGTLTPVNRTRLRPSDSFDAQFLSSGTAPVTFTPQSLYVTNSISNSVAQFSIDPATGALTSLGAPFTGGSGASIGTQPQGLAVQPNDNLLYIGDFASAQIDSFSVTTNGALSSSGLQPVVVPGESPASLTTDLSGSFLYIANQLGGNIGELVVGSAGALGPIPTTTSSVAGSAPVFVTTEPSGLYIYAANSGPGSISAYSIHLPDGALTTVGSSVSAGIGTDWIVADPSGRFLYSAAPKSNTLQEFLITAGTGLPTVNASVSLPSGPSGSPGASAVVVEPTGKYVYVTQESLNQIFAFTIDPSTGVLTLVQTGGANGQAADTGTTPVALAVDISGQYLYCVNSGSNDINIYKINLADGTLAPVATATVPTSGTTPVGIALTGTLK